MQPYAKALVDVAGANNLLPRVTSTRRSHAQQARLYRAYQQGLQQYPVAPPGTSAHEFGYAMDMVVSDMDYLPSLGDLWKSWGGIWGGEFNDPIHFEFPGFKAAQTEQQYLIGPYADTALSLFVPTPVGAGVTLSKFATQHKWVGALLSQMAGVGFDLTPMLDWEMDQLPSWLKNMLSYY